MRSDVWLRSSIHKPCFSVLASAANDSRSKRKVSAPEASHCAPPVPAASIESPPASAPASSSRASYMRESQFRLFCSVRFSRRRSAGREQLQPIILLMQLLNLVVGGFRLGIFTQTPFSRLHKVRTYQSSNVGEITYVGWPGRLLAQEESQSSGARIGMTVWMMQYTVAALKSSHAKIDGRKGFRLYLIEQLSGSERVAKHLTERNSSGIVYHKFSCVDESPPITMLFVIFCTFFASLSAQASKSAS